jgi:thiol-disulfide isomerase/thioredoxin
VELPNGAAFCPQCGCPMIKKAIFPPDPLEQQQTGQHSFLIGFACVLGAVMMISMFTGLALFSMWCDNTKGSYCGSTEEFQNGTNFPLYGKTLNDEDFDWESLRGKYVLVTFTATWCGPCQREIPGMLEAYEKYHDKGLEIVSVYIGQDEDEPTAVKEVKDYVEKKKLPWIILSEALTEKAGQPPQGEAFGIQSVPTTLLVDKEGQIHAAQMRGEVLQRELKKLFSE